MYRETKLLKNQSDITSRTKDLLGNSNELSVCTGLNELQLRNESYLSLYTEILARSKKSEHSGIKLVTTGIDRDNIELVKMFLDGGVQIRDVKNMPPLNFVVTDRETYAIIEKIEDKEMIRSVLISNEPEYLNYFQFVFDELWKNGVDAKVRIDNIEQNTDFGDIEVIPSSSRAADLYLKFIRKAQKEIMIMFPTANAFLRQYNMGAIKLAVEAAHRDVKVRVLMPNHKINRTIGR